jgi:glycosyltransferase involved in cell wall biosynthesis
MPLLLRRLVASLPDVDVVHAFGDDWAVGRSRALRVRTFHGSSYSEARASRGLRRLNHLVLAFLERVSARRCDVRIGVGPESADEFRCDRIMPPVTQVDPPAREPTAEATAAFIGSFHGRKRGWLAEQLVEQASAELGRPITLHVIGPADDAGNWKPRTVHHAGLADDQVLQVLARSWLLLAPSAYEGFGIPTYEAIACGVPVVSSPNPGSTYLAGLTNDDRVLTIAADPDLPSSTVRTITRGPLLGPAASTAAAGAVDRLLAMASADRLVDEVYRSPRSRR